MYRECNNVAHTLALTVSAQASWKLLSLLLGLVVTTSVVASTSGLHQRFDEVLATYVSNGSVNYAGIASDPRLNEYLNRLATTDPQQLSDPKERLAYWINAYNAFAIKGIIDGGSPSSFFGRIGYFKNRTYRAGGEDINLYDLERDVLIPMNEPRIHFAIVCASMSCPLLISEAYTAEKLDQQLETNAREFINDERKNRFDRQAKVAHLSKIFDWFDKDFEKHSGSVLRYVAQYVDDPELAAALERGDYRVKHLPYDWSLNGTPPAS